MITESKMTSPVASAEPTPPAMATGSHSPATPPVRRGSRLENLKTVIILLLALGVLGVVLAVSLGWELPGLTAKHAQTTKKEQVVPLRVELVANEGDPKVLTHTLMVPEEVREALGIRKNNVDRVAIAIPPISNQTLELPGSTALNPAKIARMRIRFPTNGAEVVSIGKTTEGTLGATSYRELRPGDTVKAGQELATFYSVDVGSKKNDLIDAICQLKLDEEIYKRALDARGAVPEVFILNAARAVAGDINAVNRAVKNLETWNVPPEDIKAVRDEAEELSKIQKLGEAYKPQTNPEREKSWGQVTIKSPIDGVIIERNVSEKEIIVDTTINVFQIANVDDLLVLANAPEDQLPRLREIKEKGGMTWTVQTAGSPVKYKLTERSLEKLRSVAVPAAVLDKLKNLKNREFETRQQFEDELGKALGREEQELWQKHVSDVAKTGLSGPVDEIGYLIDQNMHTAILKGFVKNENCALRSGQYATAMIELPREKDVVEIPMAAIADDGRQTVVFVQEDATKPNYTMRRVKVTHRFDKVAYVRSVLAEEDIALGLAQAKEQGLLPFSPLKDGDRVLMAGLLELKKELDDKESALAASAKP